MSNDAPIFSSAPRPQSSELDALVTLVDTLLSEGGCPWDREQTPESLVKYLIEETYELVDAIEAGTQDDVKEELGDVLYQVLFQARIAASFDIDDIAQATRKKMEARHPHVFGDAHAETADDVVAVWDAAKAREKAERTSVLDGIAHSMPALALADKVVGRGEKLGLLDPNVESAIALDDEAEVGRLLLAIVAAARSKGFDPERALRTTVRDLEREIHTAEHAMQDAGIIGVSTSDANIENATDGAE